MSAGDVTFIGWTGGSTNYKELAPSITLEPSYTTEYLRKRAVIRRICFNADKQAVIQNLPFDNSVLTSVYVDGTGALQSASLGGGWRLLNADDTPYKKGFSLIQATYEKTVSRVLELGLPTNLSVGCASGVGFIKYKNFVLESFDSGMTTCNQGLQLVSLLELPPAPATTDVVRAVQFDGTRVNPATEYAVYPDYLPLQSGRTILSYQFQCNGVVFDSNEIKIDALTRATKKSVVYLKNRQAGDSSEQFTEAQIAAIDQYYKDDGMPEIEFPSSGTYTGLVQKNFRYSGGDSQIYDLWAQFNFEYYDLSYYRQNLVEIFPKWERTGNLINLSVGGAIIRQYDVGALD
jgi:hypothetical protein